MSALRDSNGRISKNVRKPRTDRSSIMEELEKQYVAGDDKFALGQAKRAADMRVRQGRATQTDLLAFNLRFIDSDRDVLEDDPDDASIVVSAPDVILRAAKPSQLGKLQEGIQAFLTLEENTKNHSYWAALKILCFHRQ